ncbi:caspase-8 [Archocentrus centrarchus]|uniref:caspase-8 n=1 Tax=Archocentrus centrarchus TaxID=63155 RepID=UPI0011E9D7C8|nr:caspase-8-like [Archocentrus centrarchus]
MMDRLTLSRIDEDLGSSEVAELCFLCRDVVPRKRLEGIKDARELFLRLEEKGVLNDLFLKELLNTIHRADLLRVLETDSRPSKETVVTPVLSDYRKVLYRIYDDMTEENLGKLKFMLTDKVGKRQLETCQTALDVFAEMEKSDFISDTNVNLLHQILPELDHELANIIQRYTQGVFLQQEVTFPLDNQRTPEQLSITETQPSYVNRSIHTDAEPQPPSGPELSEYYPLTHNPRGLCVVFNNEIFTGSELKDRGGTQKDADALDTLFTRLGFEVVIHNNLTAAAMLNEIRSISTRNFQNDDALVVCVLSHGERGCVFGTDGNKVHLEDLTFPFTSGRAPTLAGKPKLFFIQACQGDQYQKGFVPCTLRPGEEENERGLETDAGPPPEAVPSQADFLIGMATVEEYKSFRNTVTGSIYIQELCRQLMSSAESREMDDILAVLTRVNREVSKGDYLHSKQMPQPKYTLTKKLVLKYVT